MNNSASILAISSSTIDQHFGISNSVFVFYTLAISAYILCFLLGKLLISYDRESEGDVDIQVIN